ncbi:MAG TPA: DUF2007 domain-containing protein [Parvularculaceae bacterium]|nr:DUF2007 domain-containing protein [Parvularculaceae bacterium]
MSRGEIEECQSLAEANVMVGFLQANGIDAELADAHMHSVLPGGFRFNGYRVVAPAEQVLAAKRLLAEINASPPPPESEAS